MSPRSLTDQEERSAQGTSGSCVTIWRSSPRTRMRSVTFEDVKPGAFDDTSLPGEPMESNWIVIDDHRYKVFALPAKTPTFTCYFGYGGLVEALLGFIVMMVATRGDDAWGARIYRAKNRWYNAPYHRVRQDCFDTEEDARARATEFIESLKAGVVPPEPEAGRP